jgi:glycosyltransferase involved in cell wall biosynthesis
MSSVLLVVGPATGGMGSHVAGLATGLPALGWSVTVLTSPQTAERFDLGDRSVGNRVLAGWPRGRGRLLPALWSLRRLLRGTDVVHAHGHQAGLLTVLLAATLRRRNRPVVVVTWHNAVLGSGPRRRLLGVAEKVQARRADLVIGASQDLVERARRLGSTTARLAEVAAPLPRTDRSAAVPESAGFREPADPAHDGPVVLTVSRIAPQKRLDVLVEAAALLAARVPGVRWLVAGDGDAALLAELERRSTELTAPVTFLGARPDVPKLMSTADAFALPSGWEARALVVQEAMAAGLPVVATAVGGLPELLGATGLLVPPGDPQALADALERLLTDPALAADLAEAARERFAGLPTEDEVVAAWAQRYDELLAGRAVIRPAQ